MNKAINYFSIVILWVIAGMIFVNFSFKSASAQSRILMSGEPENHQGIATWNADGSGPEPADSSHQLPWGSSYEGYYVATADYGGIEPQSNSGLTATSISSGFSNFNAALSANNFTLSDVTFKFGLYSLGNDNEGEDWWVNEKNEITIYQSEHDFVIQLKGEDMVAGPAPAMTWDIKWDARMFYVESDTFIVEDRSKSSSAAVQAVAAAFMADISDYGLRFVRPLDEITSGTSITTGQGRSGNIHPSKIMFLETVELPAQPSYISIRGNLSDNQGLARWNADGNGSEPAATGHKMINNLHASYYLATVDYGGIDTLSNGGFHFTGTALGFSNFISTLSGNGFSFSDVTVKYGLYDLGNDIEGEDWWVNGNVETWILKSEQDFVIQVNGEDMVSAPAPTLFADLDFASIYWSIDSDTFFVEDRSGGSSTAVQAVAAAFLSDLSGSGVKLIRDMAGQGNEIVFSGQGRNGTILDAGEWRIEIVDATKTGFVERTSFESPNTFKLQQNYPNPFNPSTNISYYISQPSHVILTIYNLLGQKIKTLVNEIQAPGEISVIWDGRNEIKEIVGSGVYFYQLQVSEEMQIRKMLLLQ